MKFKMLYTKAKNIDHLIDENGGFGLINLPLDETKNIVQRVFPNASIEGSGRHKIAFSIQSNDVKLILKVGKKEGIENEHKVYKSLPNKIRRRYYAEVFWHTKYCLLQEYGQKVEVTEEQLANLREIVGPFGIIDVRSENVKNIGGQQKLIDANKADGKLSGILKLADNIKTRLEVIRSLLYRLIKHN